MFADDSENSPRNFLLIARWQWRIAYAVIGFESDRLEGVFKDEVVDRDQKMRLHLKQGAFLRQCALRVCRSSSKDGQLSAD